LAVVSLTAAGSSAALAQDWSDTFESYSVGQQMHNVGGWTGWDDDPNVVGSITNQSAHGGTKSMRIENADDAIHPFNPPYSSGTGVLRHWVRHPIAEFLNDSYVIYQSVYNHAGPYDWVVEVQFDFDGNGGQGPATVVDDFRTETQRVDMVFDTWVEVRVEVNFAADTCVTYYNNQQVSSGLLWYDADPDHFIANPDMYTVGAAYLLDDISVTGLSSGGGGGYQLSVTGSCPGNVTISWTGAGAGQHGLVLGNQLGQTTIPGTEPCAGTVLGIQGGVMLIDPPGIFSTGGGSGSISGNCPGAVSGKRVQGVKRGTPCTTSNVIQLP
jgi:hypothetical protein